MSPGSAPLTRRPAPRTPAPQVGNIPKHYNEEDLLPLFERVGAVVELSITRDKVSKASKGSAFLWWVEPRARLSRRCPPASPGDGCGPPPAPPSTYPVRPGCPATPLPCNRYATAATAEAAIQTFNMRHALPDLTGRETRPLAVRPANVRAAAAAYSSGGQQRGGMARSLRPPALQGLGQGGLQGLAAQPQQGGLFGWPDATSPLGGWRPAGGPGRAAAPPPLPPRPPPPA
jgi:hypothetical protein